MTTLQNSLAVWFIGNPEEPKLVGTVRLDRSNRHCILDLDAAWRKHGFPLSPDLTLDKATHYPAGDLRAPGALDDAMPDRWGERMIRVLSRPSRLTPLDKLWYAGDRRFGALGISSSYDNYVPVEEAPLLRVESLSEATQVIARVLAKEPIDDRERQLIGSGNSMGGAHPKMLVEHEGVEWIAKFPRGNNVDQLLIEHASMELARRAGLCVADSMVVLSDIDHVLMVRRFDRDGAKRMHAASARTMLVGEGDDSYATIGGLLRKHAGPDMVRPMQRELFRRMVFNIMIDNTDDHTKNHAFIRHDDGYWGLSPAYDIPPQMNGLGIQAIQISPSAKHFNDFTIEHAMAAAQHFGMMPEEAAEEWNHMAGWVNEWAAVFSDVGVSGADIDYLSDFLDSDSMLDLRRDAITADFSNDVGSPASELASCTFGR